MHSIANFFMEFHSIDNSFLFSNIHLTLLYLEKNRNKMFG